MCCNAALKFIERDLLRERFTERFGAGHLFNKIPCGSSGGKTNARKNKTDYSSLRKPRGQKPCLGETK